MSYGKKYQCDFTGITGENYSLEFHLKDYSGAVTSITGGESPVYHTWGKDEVLPGIKGSNIEISLINEGTLPIDTFFAIEDDAWLVKYFYGANLLFIGYLVQEDFKEILVDYTHEIKLTATDNLGLLKDISLGEAAVNFGTSVPFIGYTITQLAANKIQVPGFFTFTNGQLMRITGAGVLDGLYTIKTWQRLFSPDRVNITFEQDLNGTVVGPITPVTLTVITPYDLSGRVYLSEIMGLCLKSTGLLLTTKFYGRVFPSGTVNSRLFDDILIAGETFLNGDKWDSCYSVIESIIKRLKAVIFQAEGIWNIVRWHELRYNALLGIPGVEYDSDFVYVQDNYLTNTFTTGVAEVTEGILGLESSAIRPYKYSRETFNYRNPENLLRNINLQDTGRLLNEYADGTDTIYEYALEGWGQGYTWSAGGGGYIASTSVNFIRVRINNRGEETARDLVAQGPPGAMSYDVIQSTGIEVTKGDYIKLSFDFKTNQNESGWRYFDFVIITTASPTPRSVNNVYLNDQGQWRAYGATIPPNWQAGIYAAPADDYRNSHSISIESNVIPISGMLYIKLPQVCLTQPSTCETIYSNFSFEVIRTLAGSTKVTGHQHTDSQLPVIKNNNDEEIILDNSPSNSLAGTLFLHTFTGPVRDRVTQWFYQANFYDQLGHITTKGELYWRRTPRIKLEGGFSGLKQTKHISMISRVIYTAYSGLNFVFGSLSIDYKNNQLKCTLYEMYKDTELDSDLVEFYEYKYLFK